MTSKFPFVEWWRQNRFRRKPIIKVVMMHEEDGEYKRTEIRKFILCKACADRSFK